MTGAPVPGLDPDRAGYVDPRPLADQERRDFLAELREVIAAASILHTTVSKGAAGLWQRGYVAGELGAVRRHLAQARRVLLDQARREDLAACDAHLRSQP